MLCDHCGIAVGDNDAVCGNCGQPVKPSQRTAKRPATPAAPAAGLPGPNTAAPPPTPQMPPPAAAGAPSLPSPDQAPRIPVASRPAPPQATPAAPPASLEPPPAVAAPEPAPAVAAPEPPPQVAPDLTPAPAPARAPASRGGGSSGQIPMKLLIWTGAALALGLVLYLGQTLRPYGTPDASVDELLEALITADIAKLRSEERLGFKARVKSETSARGRAEYYRVLSLFSKARAQGSKRYMEIRRKVWQLGESTFKAQPSDAQLKIRNKSKNAWLAEKAFTSLSAADQTLVGSGATLQDRASLEALAFTAGLDSLSAEDQVLIEGKDPASEEVQTDPALSALAAKATRAGLSHLLRLASRANRAARAEFRKISRKEQSAISKSSYMDYVFKSGLAAYKEADRSLIKSTGALMSADSTAASALKTALGLSTLEAKDRKEIESRDEKALAKTKKAFIKAEGAKQYAKFLLETFTKECCSVGTVRFLGASSRSLLRNSTAIVKIEYEGDDEESKDKGEEKTEEKADEKDEAKDKVATTKEEKKKKEEEKKKIKPKDYLGEVAIVTYKDGTWQNPQFSKMPKSSGEMKTAGALAALKDPSTIVSVVLMAIFALVIVLAVALKRSGPAIACIEGATLALLLGTVQSLLQGQVSLDDLLFTPLYMAIPIWIGMRRGAEAGFMAGFLLGLGLTAASALGSVASWATLAGEGLNLSEHLLAAMFLAITGAMAARIRWPKELPVAVPLLWLLYYVSIDRGLLCSFSFYGHVFWGAAMVGIGLIVRELGLHKHVERVFQD